MQGLLYMPAILVDSQKGERCRARSGEKQLNKQRELNKNILLPHATHQSDKTIVLEWEGKANSNKTEDQELNKGILPTFCLQKSNVLSIVLLGSV